MKHYFLSIVSIFKNESHILKEWLDHYLVEGTDHFYLIDNGSTDQYQPILQSYKQVELVVDRTRYKQPDHYNRYFLKKTKLESEWVMVVDLDEFVYSRRGFPRISDYLKSLASDIAQIYVMWKEYGSAGYIQQPTSCIASFVWRQKYPLHHASHTKTIVRTAWVQNLWIHHAFLSVMGKETSCEITSDGQPKQNQVPYMADISEEILQKSCLHCNHYYAQSFEWHRTVKIPRGSASSPTDEETKTLVQYNEWNSRTNQIMDIELPMKRQKCAPIPRQFSQRIGAYYGCGNSYIDVTATVMKHFYCSHNRQIIIRLGCNMNSYFGDPAPMVKKYLIIRVDYTLSVYEEN